METKERLLEGMMWSLAMILTLTPSSLNGILTHRRDGQAGKRINRAKEKHCEQDI